MKKILIKLVSVLCAFTMLFSSVSIVAYAQQDGFVNITITTCNSKGEKKQSKNNAFYLSQGRLYAPISILEKYTMYKYDKENNAFVRAGQKYKKATSKIVMDYDNSQVNVFYSRVVKKTYPLNVINKANKYFFALDEMAAYLKAAVVHNSDDSLSIVSCGASITDAIYDFSEYRSGLTYMDVIDDLFAGDEKLFKWYSILGYFGETVFDVKLSNLIGSWGDYEKYVDILESSITNTGVYEKVLKEPDQWSAALKELYDDNVKPGSEFFSAYTGTLFQLYDDMVEVNKFDDVSEFDNFFPFDKMEIKELKDLSKKIEMVSDALKIIDYVRKYKTLNRDNRDALNTISKKTKKDSLGRAIRSVKEKYGDDFPTLTTVRLINEFAKDYVFESDNVFKVAEFNKVKLATTIVAASFKLLGFDLKDNSGYEIMMNYDINCYINSTIGRKNLDKLDTEKTTEEYRRTLIALILVDLESYEIGNRIAKKIESSDKNHYKSDIKKYESRLAALYLAKESVKFDSVQGTEDAIKTNADNINKISSYKLITEDEAKKMSSGGYEDKLVDLLANFPNYGFTTADTSNGVELIDLNNDSIPEVLTYSLVGASGTGYITGFYVYDGGKYKKKSKKGKDECFGGILPILPMKNSGGKIEFLSYVINNDYLDTLDDSELPTGMWFWHNNTARIAKFTLKDKNLSGSIYKDFSNFQTIIWDDELDESERFDAWDNYREEVRSFNNSHSIDKSKSYLYVEPYVGFLDRDDYSKNDKLRVYKQAMSKEDAKSIVKAYKSGKHLYIVDDSEYGDAPAYDWA